MKKFFKYWLPVLLWAGMIFYASSQPYEQQDLKPTISQFLNLEFVNSLFSSTTFNYAGEEVSVQSLGPAQFIEFFIRKGAHFSVYLGLSFLLFRAIHLNVNKRSAFFISLIITVFYAMSDEYHQGFTAGRSPHVEDVLIDSVGGLVGIIAAVLFYRRKKSKQVSTDLK